MKTLKNIDPAASMVPITLFVILFTVVALSCKKKTEDLAANLSSNQ